MKENHVIDVSFNVMRIFYILHSLFVVPAVAKKMQVPATAGYLAPDISAQAPYTMPAQQQAMPGQQAASYYPNTGNKAFMW